MATQRLLNSRYSLNTFCALVVLAFSMLMAIPHQVIAADLSGDPSTNSMIQLTEESGHGADNIHSIAISAQGGEATIVIDKDGDVSKSLMPYKDYLALWEYLREMDIGNMKDAPMENAFPGQSLFKFTFQIDSETNSFSAYGVDLLSDKRYRTIARAILEVGEKYRPSRN